MKVFLLLIWSSTFQVQGQSITGNFAWDAMHLPGTSAVGIVVSDTLAPEPFRVRPLIVPAGLAVSGLLVQGKISRQLNRRVESRYPGYRTNADDYLLFAPVALGLGLSVAGVEGRHPLGEQMVLAIISGLASQGVTQTIKMIAKYPRPDGTTYDAFPSGHTTGAFTSATLLHKEYGHRSVWYSVGGYSVASGVGALRIINNRHWLSDALFGAGVGIGATEVVYMAYPWVKRKLKRKKK